MREIGIMEVGGFRVGHAQNWEAATAARCSCAIR